MYECSCGWKVQADINGGLNLYEKAFQISPLKGSSGRVARPAVVSSVYCGAETPAFRPGEERRLDYSRVVSSPQNLDKQEFRRFCQRIA